MKNSSSNIKVWCYRRIFWNTLLIWIKIVTVYWTFVREFFIVNGEFSDLRCLMNTLWTQSMKLLLSFVLHAKQKQNPLPLHTSSKHLDHFLCPHQGNYALEQLLPMFEDLYSNNNLVANIGNSFVVFTLLFYDLYCESYVMKDVWFQKSFRSYTYFWYRTILIKSY